MKNELKKLSYVNFIMLTLAGLINAFGITVFLMPVNLYDSGISGTSMLLGYVTPEYLSLSIFLLVLNLPLFLYGLKRQGLAFTIYASYAVACYSLFSWLITYVLPIDVATSSPLAGDDKLLCAVFGGLISGVGSGLAVRFGGAMDGIEVLAVIFSKRLGMTVGTFVMIYNVILYIVCGFVFASWELPLYSIIAYYAALKTLDFIVEGISRSKAAFIVTVRPEEVGKALSEGFGCGITEIPAKGGYSGTDRTLIYFVVNRFQIGKMRSIVHDVDPTAYITINEVADIFSANHDTEKEKETSAAR
ncbi:MAG: YitT family protein [Oscillospiraceae bacterium]|nr:YitT family protein [Oscillospiraceae bacterium]